MISFLLGITLLILGYFIYAKFVDKLFGPTDKPTPAVKNPDGVDYIPMSNAKAFLIQLLNIAGLGPIFGAVSGALWGPCVYLWIVFGTIFAGGVHDYMSGMLSLRNDGSSITEVTGKYLGKTVQNIMRVVSLFLLIMIGVVFMVGPAGLLAELTSSKIAFFNIKTWTIIILIYYFLATLLPVDKIIGRFYPILGICLIIMAVGIAISTMIHSGERPMLELTLTNLYPSEDKKPIWPLMFITVACGAISGFHSTQSPVISRTMKSERDGRKIFYGAMVAEGIIALIWASAAIAFYYNPSKAASGMGLERLLALKGGNATSVYEMCKALLPGIGTIIAMLGVIACPITSGDTAFRSARMIIFDWFKLNEKSIKIRLSVAVPLLLTGYFISFVDYSVVWRYFSWANQTLAMIVLWSGACYFVTNYSNKNRCWICAVPATFMTAVSITYLFYAPECFNLVKMGQKGSVISYVVGIVAAITFLVVFIVRVYTKPEKTLENQNKIIIGRQKTT